MKNYELGIALRLLFVCPLLLALCLLLLALCLFLLALYFLNFIVIKK